MSGAPRTHHRGSDDRPIGLVVAAPYRRHHAARAKLVERAKAVLMARCGVGEDEAYPTLRRMAMEKNLQMSEVTERAIGVAALLG